MDHTDGTYKRSSQGRGLKDDASNEKLRGIKFNFSLFSISITINLISIVVSGFVTDSICRICSFFFYVALFYFIYLYIFKTTGQIFSVGFHLVSTVVNIVVQSMCTTSAPIQHRSLQEGGSIFREPLTRGYLACRHGLPPTVLRARPESGTPRPVPASFNLRSHMCSGVINPRLFGAVFDFGLSL